MPFSRYRTLWPITGRAFHFVFKIVFACLSQFYDTLMIFIGSSIDLFIYLFIYLFIHLFIKLHCRKLNKIEVNTIDGFQVSFCAASFKCLIMYL